MKKISKKILWTILLALSLILPTNVIAIDTQNNISNKLNTPSENSFYDGEDYVIDAYDINIHVNENNTFDITETITAYFNTPKHGIYRKIPLNNKIVRLDGTSSTNRAQISNLSINNKYEISKTNSAYNIQIGDANKTVTGKQTYIIKYTYNIGKDPVKDYDELYFNIIGNEWDTTIGNVTFTITMPKEFDENKLGFSHGEIGSTDSSDINYQVNDNVISGNYNRILNKSEALTVRCELPEGYFVDAKLNRSTSDYLIIILPVTSLLISFSLWFTLGRDKKIVETVEFYPPEGFNSLEIGFLYKGQATNTDVTSLLIYLADKGYIQISETSEESLFKTVQGFKITKIKDYDGNDANERIFLDGLFKPSTFSLNKNAANEATKYSLYNNFYITVNEILKNVNSKENNQKIFDKKSLSKKRIIILLMLISYALITIVPILNYGDVSSIIFALLFPIMGFAVVYKSVFEPSAIFTKIFALIWGILFIGISWLTTAFPSIIQDTFYTYGYIIGIICIIGMSICLKYMPKRNAYGTEILGKIKGFKTFLENVEKNKLETMIMQNPNYFYDILPYTYVLGVSDKWIKKFETITMPAPIWYTSSRPFNVIYFGHFIDNTMSSASSAMSSSPNSSGGSSGGGSAGGGSGGGGGGSW